MRAALQEHPLDPAAVDEVVEELPAPGRGEGVVDLAQIETQRAGLGLVDVEVQLRRIRLVVGANACQDRILGRESQQLVLRRDQLAVAKPGAVFQLQVEARRAAEARHRGRHQDVDLAVAHGPGERPRRALGDGRGAVLGARAILPVAQVQEGLSEVLPVAAEVEAGDREQGVDVLLLVDQEVVLDLLADRDGARLGGADRQSVEPDHRALVLDRQEGGGQPHEQHRQDRDQDPVEHERRQRPADDPPEGRLVAFDGRGEGTIEPAEEAPLPLGVARFERFQQGRAERRRQDQRHQDR